MGNLIDTIVDPPKYFTLTYKLYPNGIENNWASILRFTGSNNNCCNWPDRWLMMKFRPNNYEMHFVAGTTVRGNAHIDKNGIVGNTWNEVKVEAIGDKISLYINDELKGSLSNSNRPILPEVKVWAGDKYHRAANAKISDLTFTPLESDTACLPKSGIDVYVNACSYDKLVSSIQQTLHYGDPITHDVTPCIHTAADELNFHLPSNVTDAQDYIKGLCKQAQKDYENEHQVPWSDVTQMGDKFDKEYYDGNGDWNEEHQSNYPHPPVIPELWNNIDQGSYIRRVCKSCSQSSHKDIVYKRLTSKGAIDFRDLFLKNWFSDPDGEGKNIRGSDFKLFSTFEEAQNDQNAWSFCNYNDSGIGFPRDCGPNGGVGGEWNSMSRGGETDFAFYLYTGI